MTVRFGDFAPDYAPDFDERLKRPTPERREHGEIRHWVRGGGYGFIGQLGAAKIKANDIFCHRTVLAEAGIEPVPGALVDYISGNYALDVPHRIG
jgi:hypothetical protein